MTRTVKLRIIAPATPILGIRNQGGLMLELTGEAGRALTVQNKTNPDGSWFDWTNLTSGGAMRLVPLNSLTNQSPRFFRAHAN